MQLHRLFWLTGGLSLAGVAAAQAENDVNVWPFYVATPVSLTMPAPEPPPAPAPVPAAGTASPSGDATAKKEGSALSLLTDVLGGASDLTDSPPGAAKPPPPKPAARPMITVETTNWAVLPPFGFSEPRPDGRVVGFRPIYSRREIPAENRTVHHLLFPFFRWETEGPNAKFSFFNLINYTRRPDPPPSAAAAAGGAEQGPGWRAFDAWPFYFSRRRGNAEHDYRAVFPLFGPIKHRFGNDRIDFVLFPLWSRWQKDERVETDVLWPIFKHVRGGGERGFDVWPLFGSREKEGVSKRTFALWPIYLDRKRAVEGGGLDHFRAVLPLYSLRTTPTKRDATYALFFGSTHDSATNFHETRYFWPFVVQSTGPGKGEFTRRWAPFYTHSLRKGVDKTWVLWPAYRRETFTDGALEHRKTQFLYFVYWDLKQSDPQRPQAAAAHKTHYWPLASAWDNGAGRKQFQLFSPLEVFFPRHEGVHTHWSPLFAVYRSDRRGPDEVNTSALFRFLTYRRKAAHWRFDLGPLLRVERREDRTRLRFLPVLFSRSRSGPTAGPAATQP